MKNPAYFFLQFPITVLLIVCILLVYEAQVCSANETHIPGNLMTALGAILGIAGIFKNRVRQLEKILNESDFDFTGLRAIFWGGRDSPALAKERKQSSDSAKGRVCSNIGRHSA